MVANEIRAQNKMIEDLFAATPRLEAGKFLVSMAASQGRIQNERIDLGGAGGMQRKVIMHIDVRRAYFYAEAFPQRLCRAAGRGQA